MSFEKISVIMPSFLGDYEGGATDRLMKFRRAVDSFLCNNHGQKELIIVSDGCALTNGLYQTYFSNRDEVKLVPIDKQPMFSGNVRNWGLKVSTGDIVTYLDSDDIIGVSHLNNLVIGFNNNPNSEWVYFDDYVKYFQLDHLKPERRNSELKQGMVGTSNIAHRRLETITWAGFDHYGHDWAFINNLMAKHPNYTKIGGGEYIVCHIPNNVDV